LQTGEIRGFAIRVELVIQFEHHSIGILGVGKCLQMPCILAVETAAIPHFHGKVRDRAVQLGHTCGKIQNLSATR